MGLERTFSEMKGNGICMLRVLIGTAMRSGRDEYDDLRTYDYEAGRILKALLGQVSHVRKYKLSKNFHDLVIRTLLSLFLFLFSFFLEIRCTVNLLMFPHRRGTCPSTTDFHFINRWFLFPRLRKKTRPEWFARSASRKYTLGPQALSPSTEVSLTI